MIKIKGKDKTPVYRGKAPRAKARGKTRTVKPKASRKADNGSMLLRGIPQGLTDKLETERARRGFRSRNQLILTILQEQPFAQVA